MDNFDGGSLLAMSFDATLQLLNCFCKRPQRTHIAAISSLSLALLAASTLAAASSLLSAWFSFSRNAALRAIWFSLSLLASLERLAAWLFLMRFSQ